MTATHTPINPNKNLLAGLPPPVVALLRDDANLSLARQALDEARRDAENRLADARAKRPMFGLLASKHNRDDYTQSLASAEQLLATLLATQARVTAAHQRLTPSLRAALIQHLGTTDPLWHQGLRATRYHEHWHRLYHVIHDRITGFLRDLRSVHSAITDDLANKRARHSGDTTWRIGTLRTSAAELEHQHHDLNQFSHEHHLALHRTPFHHIQLPRLEPWPCLARVETICGLPPAQAHLEAERLYSEYNEIKRPSLETSLGLYKAALADHAQTAETILRARWQALLTYAEAHLVSESDLETTLHDMELRQAGDERKRLAAQFQTPFHTER